MGRPLQSLRSRLVALTVVTTILVLAIASAIATWRIRSASDHALAAAVRTRLADARTQVDRAGRLRVRGTATVFVQVLGPRGNVVSASPALAGLPPLIPLSKARSGAAPIQLSPSHPDIDLAVAGAPLVVSGSTGALVVGVESQGFLDARDQLTSLLLVDIPLVVALSGVLAWLLIGRTLRVVVNLAEEADALSVSESGRGLSQPTRDDELRRLVAALNRMLQRLDTHYATNLATAAETSHRLRTPLATLRAEAELALAENDPDAARAALQRIIGDADRLGDDINRLLTTASATPDLRSVTDAARMLGPDWKRQAAAQQRTLVVTTTGDGEVDVSLLRAVVDPIVDNAIDYAAEPAAIEIEMRVDDRLTVTVTNSGPGVSAEMIDRLFEPWQGTAHTGLGLWLARQAARAAGGDVRCVLPGPPRTLFEAQLPISAL